MIDSAKVTRIADVDRGFLTDLDEDLSRATVARMVAIYLASVPARLSELRAAVATADTLAVARLAHGLKGSASMVGAASTTNLASMMEREAKAGRGASPEAIDALAAAHRRADAWLRQLYPEAEPVAARAC
jgi:HPt (histidine-containing phosphotransfer) domain-containing protein